jgi:Asp-tRNA(Asn)/Glu-tRNA(Gln) amidotransferase C subunit
MERTPVKKEGIAALAKASRLDLSKERAELLVAPT